MALYELTVNGLVFHVTTYSVGTSGMIGAAAAYEGQRISGAGWSEEEAVNRLRQKLFERVTNGPVRKLTPQQYRILESDPQGEFDWPI